LKSFNIAQRPEETHLFFHLRHGFPFPAKGEKARPRDKASLSPYEVVTPDDHGKELETMERVNLNHCKH
jgi:hypothetical protein